MVAKSGEFKGKTVEAAVTAGLAALGLSRGEVEVEVVRPGSRGLLGIGAEDAVVRLTAISGGRREPTPPAPPPVAAPRTEAAPRPERGERPERAPRAPRAPRTERTERPERMERPERVDYPVESDAASFQPEVTGVAPVASGDVQERARAILVDLLRHMNVRARVDMMPQVEEEDGETTYTLNVVGEDLGILIGRQSEVLNALQFLLRLMINQETHGRANIVVDVNGYKAKRAESLRKLAVRTAEQVLQTGRTMALEPMTPAERRIVHLALRDDPRVTTLSVGEGTRRKVTVVPKKD